MIVVDSPVFVAILAGEPDAEDPSRSLAPARRRIMSAGTYLECAIVAGRRFGGRTELEAWLARRDIEIAVVDAPPARIAADAFARDGKGRHPVGLNFGDCFSYALKSRSVRRCSSKATTSRAPTRFGSLGWHIIFLRGPQTTSRNDA